MTEEKSRGHRPLCGGSWGVSHRNGPAPCHRGTRPDRAQQSVDPLQLNQTKTISRNTNYFRR